MLDMCDLSLQGDNWFISKPITRLIGITAGMGDPLVAIYTKCYIYVELVFL